MKMIKQAVLGVLIGMSLGSATLALSTPNITPAALEAQTTPEFAGLQNPNCPSVNPANNFAGSRVYLEQVDGWTFLGSEDTTEATGAESLFAAWDSHDGTGEPIIVIFFVGEHQCYANHQWMSQQALQDSFNLVLATD